MKYLQPKFFEHTNTSPEYKANYDTIDWTDDRPGEHEWRAVHLRSKLRYCKKCGRESLKQDIRPEDVCPGGAP